jgi:hypothetical protein
MTEVIIVHRDNDENSPTFNEVQWNGVSLGEVGDPEASIVQLAELPMDEVCGGTVENLGGEMTVDVGGTLYEILPATLKDSRKFVFIGRRVEGGTPVEPEVPPAEPEVDPRFGLRGVTDAS